MPAWVGIYFGLAAAASLIAQMGCGSFIIRYGALRMSQVALVLLGGGMAAAAEGGLLGFGASAIDRRRRRRDLDADQLATARPGVAAAPRAAGVLDQADRGAGRAAARRVSRPGDGGGLGMARRDAGDRRPPASPGR